MKLCTNVFSQFGKANNRGSRSTCPRIKYLSWRMDSALFFRDISQLSVPSLLCTRPLDPVNLHAPPFSVCVSQFLFTCFSPFLPPHIPFRPAVNVSVGPERLSKLNRCENGSIVCLMRKRARTTLAEGRIVPSWGSCETPENNTILE